MTTEKFPFSSNVTVIGDGECSREVFEEALKFAPNLVAADGGAARALVWGQVPALVVGDMDSLAPDMRQRLPEAAVIAIDEQDTSDFDKVLRVISAPLILGVGLLGGRLDHALASLSTLARAAPGRVVLLTDREVCFHAPPALDLELVPGDWFSLFPMRRVAVRGRGLVWPLDDLVLEPAGLVGTSNRVAGDGLVRIEADGPGLLTIVPRTALAEVLTCLGQPA